MQINKENFRLNKQLRIEIGVHNYLFFKLHNIFSIWPFNYIDLHNTHLYKVVQFCERNKSKSWTFIDHFAGKMSLVAEYPSKKEFRAYIETTSPVNTQKEVELDVFLNSSWSALAFWENSYNTFELLKWVYYSFECRSFYAWDIFRILIKNNISREIGWF